MAKSTLRAGLVAACTALGLLACGGGGGGGSVGDSACADDDIRASFYYPDGLMGHAGVRLSTEPTIRGVPGGCKGAMRFELASGSLPPGISLDGRSGKVTGTPATSGQFFFDVRMSVQNFSGFLAGGVTAIINDTAAYTFTAWESRTTSAPFLEHFRLGTIGSRLFAVSRGPYSGAMETYESTDGGATWDLLEVVGPSGNLRGFALASAPGAIYLSGGSQGRVVRSAVWRFDGEQWTQMTPEGAFPARENHAMVSHGGALYILGGRAGSTVLEDTWTSTDDGVTWTLASARGFEPRQGFCAVSHQGALYVLGGPGARTWLQRGDKVFNAVFRSTDGRSWTGLEVSSTSPLMTTLETQSGACAVLGKRIVYVGDGPVFFKDGSATVGSVDGVNWSYEPHHPTAFNGITPGGVALGGRVYVSAGSGTSERTVARSVP